MCPRVVSGSWGLSVRPLWTKSRLSSGISSLLLMMLAILSRLMACLQLSE